MAGNNQIPLIPQKQIEDFCKMIGKLYQPDLIILFGSYSSNNAKQHSDVDLCIIKNTDQPHHKRGAEVRKLLLPYLHQFLFPKDIVVYTPAEFDSLKGHPNSFENTIWLTGKILYARPKLTEIMV